MQTRAADDEGWRLRAYVLAEHHTSRTVLGRAGFRLVGPDDDDPRLLVYWN